MGNLKAIEFDERLRRVVDEYNSRDKLVFTSEVVADFVNDLSDELIKILHHHSKSNQNERQRDQHRQRHAPVDAN